METFFGTLLVLIYIFVQGYQAITEARKARQVSQESTEEDELIQELEQLQKSVALQTIPPLVEEPEMQPKREIVPKEEFHSYVSKQSDPHENSSRPQQGWDIAQLHNQLRHPVGMQNAIIMAEILKRPAHFELD